MKSRTKVLLQAAEAALEGRCSIILEHEMELRVWHEMCNVDTNSDFLSIEGAKLRCFYLCFLAAACEAGDL